MSVLNAGDVAAAVNYIVDRGAPLWDGAYIPLSFRDYQVFYHLTILSKEPHRSLLSLFLEMKGTK